MDKVSAKDIFREFKLNSLVLRKDALDAIQRVLRSLEPGTSQSLVLRGLIDSVQTYIERSAGSSSIVDEECISAVVAENTRNEADVNEERFQVFSSFKLPHYQFNAARKAFFVNPKPRALHALADSKIAMYRERLVLAQQWLARHPAYSHSDGGAPGQEGGIQLVPIESLRSHHGQTVVVLGMLSCPEEGRFELEDLHSRCKLVFAPHCTILVGLITETCVVVVEGVYDQDGDAGNGELQATLVGQPHIEPRGSACSAMGVVDPLRVLDTPAEFARALTLEQAATDAFFVILSDVHLDQPSVLAGLRTILETWASLKLAPTAFVLMGPFLSHAFGAGVDDKAALSSGLADLGELIADFPALSRSSWVLVPSALDPGSGPVLPRPSLPPSFCRRLKARAPNVVLASNPCRLRYFTQELVVFRENVSARLGKHAIKSSVTSGFEFDEANSVASDDDERRSPPPAAAAGAGSDEHKQEHATHGTTDEEGDTRLDESNVTYTGEAAEGGGADMTLPALQTMLHQAHLLPLPLRAQAVHWEHDHALRLYPPPHVLAVGESCSEYTYTVEGTRCFNPGSFAAAGKFVVYYPHSGAIDMSQL